jgi:ring-1,2-phenylacetyl-CoA epoxidase subunit PaaC
LKAIAEKGLKEIAYHRRWSSEWVIRLGDGTDESHDKIQAAVDSLWEYTGELFTPDTVDTEMHLKFNTPDISSLYAPWKSFVSQTLESATIDIPSGDIWMQKGGKSGIHTEHLGYILSELQYMQRTFPAMQW